MEEFHPFLDKSLKFKWSKLIPSQAKIDIPLAIKNCQEKIGELINLLNLNDEQITFKSTFKVYDDIFDELSQAWSLFTHLNSVKDSPDQRSAFKELNPQYIDFCTSIYHNSKLYQLFKRSYSKIKNELNDPTKRITDVELRYVEKVMNDFQRSGADLDDEKKEELAQINKELAEVTDLYKKNLLDSRVEFEFFVKKGDEYLLDGLPETAIGILTEDKNEKTTKSSQKSKKKKELKNNNNTNDQTENQSNQETQDKNKNESQNNNNNNDQTENQSNQETQEKSKNESNQETQGKSKNESQNNNDQTENQSNQEIQYNNKNESNQSIHIEKVENDHNTKPDEFQNNSETAKDDGFYRFTLDSVLVPLVMKYARNESIRKRMWDGLCSIGRGGIHDNSDLVFRILELRDRKAKMLGFGSFADFMTENRMIKTGDNALRFVDELRDRCYTKYIEENKELRRFKYQVLRRKQSEANSEVNNNNNNKNTEENDITNDTPFSDDSSDCEVEVLPWERAFYSELLRQERYDFNDELLRPYFSVSNIMKGVFTVTSTLYGIEVIEKRTFYHETPESPPIFNKMDGEVKQTKESESEHSYSIEDSIEVWSKDVKYYEVFDKQTKKLLGSFYADWYPRTDKRSGAWEKQLVLMSSVSPFNIASINGNIAKEVGDKPALLTRRSAKTIFHEFGHLCHFLLSKSPIKALFGTHVMRDFVEFPSRFLENWTWDKESLDLFAHHYETGELIPTDLLDKMIRARNFHSATQLMGQLRISKVDLELHHHLERYYRYTKTEISNQKTENLESNEQDKTEKINSNSHSPTKSKSQNLDENQNEVNNEISNSPLKSQNTNEKTENQESNETIKTEKTNSNSHSPTKSKLQNSISSEVNEDLGNEKVKYKNGFDISSKPGIDEIDDLILHSFRDPKSSSIRSPSLIYNSKHLFASPVGYAADYYSYKWSEVLEADAFTRFKSAGVMNAELGHLIRDTIISQGNMKPPDELFFDFMGREPDSSAFFERYEI